MQIHLISTKNFTARGIHFFMKAYCLLRNKKIPDVIYNHALLFDEKLQEVYESDFPTVVKIPYSEWKNKKKNKTAKIKILDIKFSYNENNSIKKYAQKQVGKKYEVINFLWHIFKVFSGKWIGNRSDKRLYCYELIIYALNSTGTYNIDPYLNPYEFSEKFVK